MSNAWQEAKFEICYLTEQHRQNDNALNQILNQIRAENVSQDSIDALLQTRHNPLDSEITRLFTHNSNVDHINQRHLASIDADSKIFVAQSSGNEKILQTLSGAVRAPEQLQLKIGAKVMFVKNNFEAGYINGTVGEVVGFVDDEDCGVLPEVRLRDGGHLIVPPETWSVDNESGKPLATYSQIPLCLAWAMTVHKSQGMTLQAAEIDLSQTFEKGQGYVALSRLQNLQGLRLLGLNDLALQLDRLAIKADQRFMQLSEQAAQKCAEQDAKTLKTAHDGFIRQSGGTLSATEIARQEKRLGGTVEKVKSGKAAPSKHSVAQTKALFMQGLSLDEIVAQRQLSKGTIISHLAKAKTEDSKLDLSRICPEPTLLAQIEPIYRQLLRQHNADDFDAAGEMKLKPIFDALREAVPYNDIRLALLFINGG